MVIVPTVAADVPVFWRARFVPEATAPHVGAAIAVPVSVAGMLTVVAETCAVLVNDPNRPNTNPAMAMAAMRVMAMRMTVASTGEMAFLFFL